jgi:hypothetical protein
VDAGWNLQTTETAFSYFPDRPLTLAEKVLREHNH